MESPKDSASQTEAAAEPAAERPQFGRMLARVEGLLASLPQAPLANRFLSIFMRFEYALKDTGFVRNPEKPEAEWDRFANELPDLRQYGDGRVAEAIKAFR